MINKKTLKTGHILIDDCQLAYRVLEVLSNTAIVEPIKNNQAIACEVMSFAAMNAEGWIIANQ